MKSGKVRSNIMKIKIIADEVRYRNGGVISYDKAVDRNIQNRASAIERKVNDFCSKHNVSNIAPSTVVVGNNPPTAVLTYTIVYEDYIEPLPPTSEN